MNQEYYFETPSITNNFIISFDKFYKSEKKRISYKIKKEINKKINTKYESKIRN